MVEHITKAVYGMPTADPTHQYAFRSAEFGSFYQYWFKDLAGNYYRYTNAPQDSPDYNPILGTAVMDPAQPLPEVNPNFFTASGLKRFNAVPVGMEPEQNPLYDPPNLAESWFEKVTQEDGSEVFIYLDADVKENPLLYTQAQLRVVNANIIQFREKAVKLFSGDHLRDKLTGVALFLLDQGMFSPRELASLLVSDVSFVDQTLVINGRLFVPDETLYDLFTSLVLGRDPSEPLLVHSTKFGDMPLGEVYLNSVCYALHVSPKHLFAWHCSNLYYRIFARIGFSQLPVIEAEASVGEEIRSLLQAQTNPLSYVDFRLRRTVTSNYGNMISKATVEQTGEESLGALIIRSDLEDLRTSEQSLSSWLKKTPLHDE